MSGKHPRSHQPPRLPKSGVWRSGLKFDDLDVTVRWEVDADGQSVIKALLIEGPAITARKLHQVKFNQIIDPYREAGAVGIRSAGTRFHLVLPSPKDWPSGHYERLAENYRAALVKSPIAPTLALAKEYRVSKATMRKWLKYAHDNGLLPERTGQTGRPKNPREDT